VTPRLLLSVGGLAAAVLGAAVVLGVVGESWGVTAAAASLLGVGIFVLQLDTWRRTRTMQAQVRHELARQSKQLGKLAQAREADPAPVQDPTPAPPVGSRAGEDDLRGAPTMMQTQHAARLDRLQVALDLALAELTTRRAEDPR
jgi:hypothetical protein